MAKQNHKILHMIRKCFKLNTCFIEVLKNSSALHTIEQKCLAQNPNRTASVTSLSLTPHPVSSKVNASSSNINVNRSITIPNPHSNRNEKGDAESQNSDSDEAVIAETPVKTELFEIKGPNDSAFLVEVQAKDLEGVKNQLVAIKGDHFRFDKSVIEWFTIKCILRVETPFGLYSSRDQVRLSKVHAISSGCDEVYGRDGVFFFVSSVDRMTRVKKILQKFGYKVLEILYRFQPKQKVNLGDDVRDICNQFVKTVERLPEVISLTHNL